MVDVIQFGGGGSGATLVHGSIGLLLDLRSTGGNPFIALFILLFFALSLHFEVLDAFDVTGILGTKLHFKTVSNKPSGTK